MLEVKKKIANKQTNKPLQIGTLCPLCILELFSISTVACLFSSWQSIVTASVQLLVTFTVLPLGN